ncbi:stage III sporulation protein SpoIIIAB [Pseudalkalibacillus caeni]|uniref:Stage III sporulation protein SpoAB n=1 Tax=Exobacillus caeni TaxID=2574798 RepID=A0A5R9F1T1_9BACL|nr:stage III sporulation protein SpoIIIAB [Pseudalkalibacillus caeni]TLS36366.1 stage III sporulation protein SpoAB [Pseudalkalibacillus caeni]
MKILGAIIIIAASTWAGFEWAKKLSERPKQLRQLKVALQSLEAEIVYGLTPLGQACIHLAEQLPKPLAWFFETVNKKLEEGSSSAQEAWDSSLNEIWKFTAFRQGEMEVMRQLGATIGKHDRDHQQKQLRLALIHLEREEGEAKEEQVKYEKMIKSLGFLAGILLVILLI